MYKVILLQSAVCMYLVVGHERLRKLIHPALIEAWFHNYVEILQKLRLFNESIVVSFQTNFLYL